MVLEMTVSPGSGDCTRGCLRKGERRGTRNGFEGDIQGYPCYLGWGPHPQGMAGLTFNTLQCSLKRKSI